MGRAKIEAGRKLSPRAGVLAVDVELEGHAALADEEPDAAGASAGREKLARTKTRARLAGLDPARQREGRPGRIVVTGEGFIRIVAFRPFPLTYGESKTLRSRGRDGERQDARREEKATL